MTNEDEIKEKDTFQLAIFLADVTRWCNHCGFTGKNSKKLCPFKKCLEGDYVRIMEWLKEERK